MPLENLEDESLAKNPNLDYAQWKFMLSTSEYRNSEEIKTLLLNAIKENNMAPFYIEVGGQQVRPEAILVVLKSF